MTRTTKEEVLAWAKDIETIIKENGTLEGCHYMHLGDADCKTGRMYIVIGYSDCYEAICIKLAYNCDDLQCDFDWDWEMPYDEQTGDVDDTLTDFHIECVDNLYDYYINNYAI